MIINLDKKQIYRNLCLTEKSIPIFSRDWWLDAVCGNEHWDVAIVTNGDLVIGAMPYYMKIKYGFKILCQPKLTQTLGPWIRINEAKYTNQLAYQKDIMQNLIVQLPSYNYFSQNWHYSITNWLPFYWQGFEQTTHYTYIIPELSSLDNVFSELRENIRGDIRKASNRFSLQVRTNLSLDDFFKLNESTFIRQNKKVPYNKELVKKIDNACHQRNCRKIFIAEDEDGRLHAGVYIIWDENSAYYLMGGGEPDLRNSGASSLCLWEAIKYASKVTQKFDFEGSMLEPVERFVRAFGAKQTPYFNVYHTPSFLVRVIKALR